MASESDHIALANRNHDALQSLLLASDEHPEWVATVAFYKALQIIEAVFDKLSLGHCNGHQKRLEILKKGKPFAPIFKHYKALLEASEIARYLSSNIQVSGGFYHSFTDYMTMDRVKEKLLKERLMNVEMHSRAFLSDAGKATLKTVDSLSY